jgi:hypothetical protein
LRVAATVIVKISAASDRFTVGEEPYGEREMDGFQVTRLMNISLPGFNL